MTVLCLWLGTLQMGYPTHFNREHKLREPEIMQHARTNHSRPAHFFPLRGSNTFSSSIQGVQDPPQRIPVPSVK